MNRIPWSLDWDLRMKVFDEDPTSMSERFGQTLHQSGSNKHAVDCYPISRRNDKGDVLDGGLKGKTSHAVCYAANTDLSDAWNSNNLFYGGDGSRSRFVLNTGASEPKPVTLCFSKKGFEAFAAVFNKGCER